MKIKHHFSLDDVTFLNDFFNSMLYKTNSNEFQQLGFHHTYITFIYQIGDARTNNSPSMKLPMDDCLVETPTKTTLCLVEQFISKFFFIKELDKFADMNADLLFINQKESRHVGLCFDSFDELDIAIKRILDYTALLIFDDLTQESGPKH